MKLSFNIYSHGRAYSYIDYVNSIKEGGELYYLTEYEIPADTEDYNRRVVSYLLVDNKVLVTSSICRIGRLDKDTLSGQKMNKIRLGDILNADFDISPDQKNATWVYLNDLFRLWDDPYTYSILGGPLDKDSTVEIVEKLLNQATRFKQTQINRAFDRRKEDVNRVSY